MRGRYDEGYKTDDSRFATLLDEEGAPPCDPPDGCSVCRLFDHQQPGQTRGAWLERITGYPEPSSYQNQEAKAS